MLRKIGNILLLVVSVTLLLNTLLMVLVNLSTVQSSIVSYATEWLEGRTGTRTQIGRVDLDLFNGVFLEDVFLEDASGDTLLYAKRLVANASLFSAYYRGRVHLRSAEISDFKLFLSKDSVTAPYNFQFLLDAFSSSDTASVDSSLSDFDLSIEKIRIRNGALRYDVNSDSLTLGRFNPMHLHVDSLMADVSLRSIRLDQLGVAVETLSFKEWSGLVLQDLSFSVDGRDSVLVSERLALELPHSFLELAGISVDMRKSTMDSGVSEGLAVSGQVQPSHIYPPDLAFVFPQLLQLSDTLGFSTHFSLQSPFFRLSDLSLYYGEGLLLSLDASTDDLCHPLDGRFDVAMHRLFVDLSLANSLVEPFANGVKIPELIEKIDYLELSLSARGLLSDLEVETHINSLPGEVSLSGSLGCDLAGGMLRSDIDLRSDGLKMGALLDSVVGLGEVSARFNLKGSLGREEGGAFSISGGLPLLTYKGYAYRNLDLAAHCLGRDSLDVFLSLPDSNANLSMKAQICSLGADSMSCEVDARIARFLPFNLHLLGEEMKSFSLSSKIALNARGNSLGNLVGSFRLDSTLLISDTMRVFVERLSLSAEDLNGGRRIDLVAPYFSFFIDGKYDFSSLPNCFANMVHPYLPTFFPYSMEVDSLRNDFVFALHVVNTERISRVLRLPLLIDKPADVSGFFKPATKGVALEGRIPSVKWGNSEFTGIGLKLVRDDAKNMYLFDFVSKFGKPGEDYPLNLISHAEVERDVLLFSLDYDNHPCPFQMDGRVLSLVSFQKEADSSLCVKLNFMPTDFRLNDLDLGFEPAVVEFRESGISIADFGFSLNGAPLLMANGVVSKSDNDSLSLSFHRASVRHLLSAVNRQEFPIDAILDGTIRLYSLLGSPRFHTEAFRVDDISYLGEQVGSMLLNSRWNTKYQGMRMSAALNRKGKVTGSLDGYLSPANDRIKLDVHFDELPLALASLPLRGVMHGLSGYCGSDFQITGRLSAPNIDGYLYFEDAKASVDYTDVSYHISDTVFFSPDRIVFRDFDICDSRNSKLNLNCVVRHKGFDNFRYEATLRMDNLMLLNNPTKKDSLFCGTFSASGLLDVKGDMGGANLSGTLKNADWANVMIRLPESVTQVRTYDNIVYLDRSERGDSIGIKPLPPTSTEGKFDLKADLTVDLSDDARFDAVITPSTGDAISFTGEGNINVKYDSETSSTKLFGQYGIKEGTLKLKLSQLPIKSFALKEGSHVYFNGDPTACNVDIAAAYRVRADLALLDPTFASMSLPTTRVPVECGLNIVGSLKKFDVKYDITLPEANEDLSRTVNSLITTDDIRIREFAYLLGFGMFYPPNGAAEGSNSSIVSSLASSSLSGALNGALSGLLGDRFSIGTDLSSSRQGMSDLEMNVSLSTNFFNNRLVLNTSLGYKNSEEGDVQSDGNSLVGNFDAEYKLTKSGMFRLKAYNHSNNEFYNSSTTTQGLGMVFVKEAKTFLGLFDLRPNSSMNSPLLPMDTELRQDTVSVSRDTSTALPRRRDSKTEQKERRGNE